MSGYDNYNSYQGGEYGHPLHQQQQYPYQSSHGPQEGYQQPQAVRFYSLSVHVATPVSKT